MRIEQYYLAQSLDDAYAKLKEDPKNVILGGGLWLKKMNAPIKAAIDLSNLGLDEIIETKRGIEIGAMVSQRKLETSPAIAKIANGLLVEAVGQIMGPAFRNLATVGGSIVGRYPFSDLITPLLVLDTTLVFFPKREISLEEYLALKGKPEGILEKIIVSENVERSFFKKAKVTALDFPLVNIAIAKCDDKYRIAIGSRPNTAALALKAMEYLNTNASLSEKEIKKVAEIAIEELSFASTSAISEEYRKALARTYVERGLEEVK